MKPLLPMLLFTCGCGAAVAQEQPNIVILFADDLGWADLGYNNPKFETPNIDKLKGDGTYFSRAYVSTATSSPSRASLMTGKESLRCGFVRHIYDKNIPADAPREEFQTLDSDPGHMKSRAWLPLEEITYAERLKELGYYNYFIGKWHLGYKPYFPTEQGFDAMYGTTEFGHPKSYYQEFFKSDNPFPNAKEDEYLTSLLTKGATDFIANYDKDQPFLLNLWYYGVHSPHIGRKDLVEKYTEKGYSKKEAIYAAMVEALDESVGEVREAIAKKGLADNTIFIFSSDQGGFFSNAPLSEGKRGGKTLQEGGSRVPFIIYNPKAKSNGTSYDKPIQTLDVYPTLVEFASNGGKCKDKQINGVSLLPILEGKDIKDRDLFLHRSYEDQNSAIIDGDWKLIKYRSGIIQLFNIKDDIAELNNLKDTYPKRTEQMLRRLNKWQAEATPKELLQ